MSGPSQTSVQLALAAARLNLIWQMGEASLSATGNEIRLPLAMSRQLQPAEIYELERRLRQVAYHKIVLALTFASEKMNGAQVLHFEDPDIGMLRICTIFESPGSDESPMSSIMSSSAGTSPQATDVPCNTSTSFTPRVNGKKSKVPRPPNAFILYRKEWHPKIKELNPGMHNNKISIILGNQWKNESEEVRSAFRQLAERIKLQHAADHPGYQYSPRKPSEKKRRMTSKKLALAQRDKKNADSSAAASGEASTLDPSDLVDLSGPNGSEHSGPNAPPMVDEWAQFERPEDEDLLTFDEHGNVSFIMPSPGGAAIAALQAYHASLPIDQLAPATQEDISMTKPEYVENQEQLMNALFDYAAFAETFEEIKNVSAFDMALLDEAEFDVPDLGPVSHANVVSAEAQFKKILDLLD